MRRHYYVHNGDNLPLEFFETKKMAVAYCNFLNKNKKQTSFHVKSFRFMKS